MYRIVSLTTYVYIRVLYSYARHTTCLTSSTQYENCCAFCPLDWTAVRITVLYSTLVLVCVQMAAFEGAHHSSNPLPTEMLQVCASASSSGPRRRRRMLSFRERLLRRFEYPVMLCCRLTFSFLSLFSYSSFPLCFASVLLFAFQSACLLSSPPLSFRCCSLPRIKILFCILPHCL